MGLWSPFSAHIRCHKYWLKNSYGANVDVGIDVRYPIGSVSLSPSPSSSSLSSSFHHHHHHRHHCYHHHHHHHSVDHQIKVVAMRDCQSRSLLGRACAPHLTHLDIITIFIIDKIISNKSIGYDNKQALKLR